MLPKRWLNSTLTRLAWQLPLLSSLLIVLAMYPVYNHVRALIETQVWQTIDDEVGELRFALGEFGVGGLIRLIQIRIDERTDPAAVYLLTEWDGTPIVGNLRQWPTELQLSGTRHFVLDMGGERVEGQVFLLPDRKRLLVAHLSPLRDLQQKIAVALVASGLLLVIGTSLVGGITLMRYRRRLAEISTTVGRILEGDLTQRLPEQSDLDLRQLSTDFNTALDAMHGAMDAVRHVTSSIAHDMRQPISAIRYQLVEIMEDAGTSPTARDALAAALALTDETLKSFAALLRLARLESDSYKVALDPVNMAELIREAIDTYQPVAAAAGRVLRGQSAAVVVRGDRSLLFQVLQNLLDNAINHGGGDIDLDVRQEGQQVVLSVRDHGAGVPEALMPRLTERFFRVDEARSGTSSGIGLATVLAIVHALHGELTFENAAPGLRVRVQLPSLPAQPIGAA